MVRHLLLVTIVGLLVLTACADDTTAPEVRPPAQLQPAPTATSAPEPTLSPVATTAAQPRTEAKKSLDPGMYQVGGDIQPGVYAGIAGTNAFDSCYWARLSGASGDFSELIANENATGQFYVEIQLSDKYFKVDCEITPLNDWPAPDEPLSEIQQGMYLVGRDIDPGTYRDKAGTDVMNSCYWARLSGLSGDFDHLITNENSSGSFFVTVQPSDLALKTDCQLTLSDGGTLVPVAAITAESTTEPKNSLDPGMYQVGSDIQPGIYAGMAGTDVTGSCYWARLSGASGDFSELIANENAIGQFYVEIQPSDKYFKVDCEIISLSDWPAPDEPLSEIQPGMYLVGRDIDPGTYQGKAGTDVMNSCYWARLSGLSDDMDHLITNENSNGSYFVTIQPTDMALKTACQLTLSE